MGNTEARGWWFAQVPIWLICDPDLSEGAKSLFGYLKWRQGTDAACWPSKATQAIDMGVSVDTVERRQGELEKEGYLIKHLRPGHSTLYQMIADPKGKQASFEKREEERRKAQYPPAKIPGGKIEGERGGQKEGGEGGAKTPSHDDNHGSDNHEQKSYSDADAPDVCPSCEKPLCTSEENPNIKNICTCSQKAALDEAFGERPERDTEKMKPPDPDRPWADWSDGQFREREGVSAEAQNHVAWLVEKYGGLRPTGSYNGWATGAIATYKAGRGDWPSIECGIMVAFARDAQYRPSTLACSKKTADRNSIVKAVAKEWSARNLHPASQPGRGNGRSGATPQGYVGPSEEQIASDRAALLAKRRERAAVKELGK